jgi:hypothetical protein
MSTNIAGISDAHFGHGTAIKHAVPAGQCTTTFCSHHSGLFKYDVPRQVDWKTRAHQMVT